LVGTDFEHHADTFSGAWSRIEAAIAKAAQLGLGVLVDLHAAAGAQNEDGEVKV
jgi:aryl-phospho-beta-D-glucosidase BglC (GH1 family)